MTRSHHFPSERTPFLRNEMQISEGREGGEYEEVDSDSKRSFFKSLLSWFIIDIDLGPDFWGHVKVLLWRFYCVRMRSFFNCVMNFLPLLLAVGFCLVVPQTVFLALAGN